MKQFACGSVVPGCQAVFMAEEEDEILRQVAEHARVDHGISEVSPELVASVRSNITTLTYMHKGARAVLWRTARPPRPGCCDRDLVGS